MFTVFNGQQNWKLVKNKSPYAKKIPQTITMHEETRVDDYAWLKDENWQEVIKNPEKLDSKIRKYLEDENAYAERCLEDTKMLQKELFQELRSRIKEDDSSVPEKDGEYFYYVRYIEGQQYPVYCRFPVNNEKQEEILLDANILAKEYGYFDIGDAGHSPNHKFFAYSADIKGSEIYSLYVYDLEKKKLLEDVITNIQSTFVWALDNETIFYTTLDNNHRPDKVYRHKLGQDVSLDEIVYQEKDTGFFVSLDITESNNYILICAHDHVTSEVYTIDAKQPEQKARLFSKRSKNIEYEISDHGNYFYIVTNKDECEDYKIMRTRLDETDSSNWENFYIPNSGCLLRDLIIFKKFMVRSEREDGLPRIVVCELDNQTIKSEHCITFDEKAYELGVIPGYEFDTNELRFTYTSMTTPTKTFDYKMDSRERELKKQQLVPSGHDKSEYTTQRLFASSHDGEKIPISVLYKNDTTLNGTAPLLLYAYGSYGTSMPASFSTNRLSLVNRGFIYAIAHVRGGMEKGYRWYRNGKLKKKENTFKDYLSCANYLIDNRFTNVNNIAVHGASAGGMLVGAVINMQPNLFKAAIADVPFVDVLNTISDANLPLTPPEWPEWGNPIEDKEAYDNIKSYSPYDNISSQDYPNILVTAGLTDPRVTYWEPAKWVAKLREHKIDNNLLLLKTNMQAGHAGASGRFDYLKEVALMYAFLLKVFDMTK